MMYRDVMGQSTRPTALLGPVAGKALIITAASCTCHFQHRSNPMAAKSDMMYNDRDMNLG